MISKIKVLSFLVFLMLPMQSIAFNDTGVIELNDQLLEEEYLQQGVVFDRTITQSGLDFHREFSHLWSLEDTSASQSLTIKETPTARYGSVIWIEANHIQLHRVVVGQRSKKIIEKARKSIAVVQKKLGKKIIIN